MFGQEALDVEEKSGGLSKYITYGNQQLYITGFEVREAKNGQGKKQVFLLVESAPVTDKGFVPDEKSAKGGKIGKIQMTIFVDFSTRNTQTVEFEKQIQLMAKKLGIYDQVTAVKAANIDEYLTKVAALLRGKSLWFQVCAEVYGKNDKGYDRYVLKLGRYGWVAITEAELKPFDKSNKYHYGYSNNYKPMEEADAKSIEPATSTDW